MNGPMAGPNRESAAIRSARREIRAQLRSGQISLAGLLDDPPECVAAVTLWEVVTWQFHSRRCRRYQRLGSSAVAAGVNLLCPVGLASSRSRAWVAEHGTHWAPGRRQARAGATA